MKFSRLLKKQNKKKSGLTNDYQRLYDETAGRLSGMTQRVRDTANNEANQLVAGAGQRASQAENTYLAQGGFRAGSPGALFAGAMGEQAMAPARAQGAWIRANAEREVAGMEMGIAEMLAGLKSRMLETELERERMDRAERMARSKRRAAQQARDQAELAPRFDYDRLNRGLRGATGTAGTGSGFSDHVDMIRQLRRGLLY